MNETLGTDLAPEYFDMPYNSKTYQANTQADTSLVRKTWVQGKIFSSRRNKGIY